jgi:RNA polymerase sigma-70 factor (ECF subfamily)
MGRSMQSELVTRAQHGDRDAFAALAYGVSGRLYATARLILRQPDLAEDAVQETLIAAWRDLRGLRDPDRLDAWLHRLLVRACQRQLRRTRTRWTTEVELDPTTTAGALSDRSDAVAARDEIERSFRRLTAEQRTILTLVYFADLTVPDVADVLGIPLGTAKSRLHRSIAAMRAALTADRRHLPIAEGQTA